MRPLSLLAPLLLPLFGLAFACSSASKKPDEGATDAGHEESHASGASRSGSTDPSSVSSNASSSASAAAANIKPDRSSVARISSSSVPMSAQLAAITANNAFSLALYERLTVTAATENVVTSPLSANLALTMAYAGAKGSTATGMAQALQLGDAASTIFAGQDALTQGLASRAAEALSLSGTTDASKFQLQVVNSVWGEQTYTWASPFLDTLAADYGTGVFPAPFSSDPSSAILTINAWVSAQTDHHITNILPSWSITDKTRIALVNAIHLQLPWGLPFDASQTQPADFASPTGPTTANYMTQEADFNYIEDGAAQIISLPLGTPLMSQVVVVVALPHKDLASFEAGLTTDSAAFKPPTKVTDVMLSLPKISFGSPGLSLTGPLSTMGMASAFRSDADFSGMTGNQGIFLDDVLQKAEIAMTEVGVQASAATVVLGGDGGNGSGGEPPLMMNVNRPYFVSIIDVPTGAVLFMGHVVDPSSTGTP